MYKDILAPLAKEKHELLARISQALTAGPRQPATASSSSSACVNPAAAAAALSADDLPFSQVNHFELLQMMSRVDVIQTQLWWLDMCCSCSCMGFFSWWQIGTMIANFTPYPPVAGLVVRRLVARTSLMLLLPVLPYPQMKGLYLGGSDAPWHVPGVPVEPGLQTTAAEQQQGEVE
jgi:hypothetical protein